MNQWIEKYKESATLIAERIKPYAQPAIGIILGSGLSKLADNIENPITIPYADIPNFKISTATGHKGNLIIGQLGGKIVLAMQGRFHYYEGYTMQEVTLPVRVMHYLGVKILFVSNAAGGINPEYKVGDLMIIKDHINFLPNPLIGPNIEELGPRFPDMTRAYDRELITLMEHEASKEKIKLRKGVYVGLTGPSFETPAEYAFFGKHGGDAIGMSTIPEVIIARHCGMRVFGMSVISNEAHHFDENFKNDGNEVIKAADQAANTMSRLFLRTIEKIKL